MNKVLKFFIWRYLQIQYAFYKITKTGSFGERQAVFIETAALNISNALKSAMIKHHVKQYHEASCSVASVANVVNAVAEAVKGIYGQSVSQMDLLDNVREAHWKERMQPEGHHGRRGLPLPVFGDVVKNSFDVYKLPYKRIEVVQASRKPEEASLIKERLRSRLEEYEQKGDVVIIAHFNQGIYLKALQIPHISPVGGFDPKTGMVTILDVDYLQKKHYQIDFDRFYEGLSNHYNYVFRAHGFNSGGYIYIKL